MYCLTMANEPYHVGTTHQLSAHKNSWVGTARPTKLVGRIVPCLPFF